MINIQKIQNISLTERIEAHREMGGALRISVFEIKENYLGQLPDEYNAHLATARQTLEKENFDRNLHFNKVASKNHRGDWPYATTDFDRLDPSGKKIDLFQFLGPEFDLETMKPLIRGQLGNDTNSSYFYYDQDEIPTNAVDLDEVEDRYIELYNDDNRGFTRVLLEPPYGISLGRDIYLHGAYLLDFFDYFFSDINKMTVYMWDTNCSAIFDPGKEWWGSYFWTLYNPTKNWYLGMIASETD